MSQSRRPLRTCGMPDMDPTATWESLFDALLDLPPAEREAPLAEIEQRDPALAQRLRALLAADDDASDSFLGRPVAELPLEAFPAPPEGWRDLTLPAGTLIGPYRIVTRIGQGGMGEVYLAERADGAFEQKVALKLIKRGMDSAEIVRRFLTERQILAHLDHPGIARLLDGGSSADGRPYFVMEHVDGEPLLAHCARTVPSVEERVRLIREIAEAVDAAHQRLVVHRDLKPSNILLTRDGRVKLLDFGIAKLTGETAGTILTRLESRALTPAYAAPEQILGEPITTATDVYALGVLLYQLLAGRLPHEREARALPALVAELESETLTRASTAVRSLAGEQARALGIDDPARFSRRLAGDLDTILARALERDPARRYRSAAAFAEDLGRFLDGKPILARPVTALYRLKKWVRRNRLVAGAAALVVLSLTGGLAVSLWQARVARQETERAERIRDFLISIFLAADPSVAQGSEATARQLLARGAERVGEELEDDPGIQADLLAMIAHIENELGLSQSALEHARRGLTALGPSSSKNTLRRGYLRFEEGSALLAMSQIEQSIAPFEEAIALLSARLKPGELSLTTAKTELASSYFNMRQYERAVVLLEEVYEERKKAYGEDDPDAGWHLVQLANALREAMRWEEAEAGYRRSVEVMERAWGGRHPATADGHVSLGSHLALLGELGEAEAEVRKGLGAQREIMPPGHPVLPRSLIQLGRILYHLNRFEESEAAVAEALSLLPPGRWSRGVCLRQLGLVRLAQGRPAEAVPLFEEAASVLGAQFPEESVRVQQVLANLGLARGLLGQVAEGEAALRRAIARIEEQGGAGALEALLPRRQLGQLLLATGRPAEAVAVLSALRERELELYGRPDHFEVVATTEVLDRAREPATRLAAPPRTE
ncbi:MAG TPA: serine/threonine-protein kinase [Thermoanaerobaculia bacterium]|nr:serine/threonine-protein kinase [Thermoanaerobaculia bacterium]